MSHPVWVRGLKLCSGHWASQMVVSHPVWVRGLKRVSKDLHYLSRNGVAPRVGAWIETRSNNYPRTSRHRSHPVWVRGLKPGDFKLTTELAEVAPRVGAWIETLVALRKQLSLLSRTPCGCVD